MLGLNGEGREGRRSCLRKRNCGSRSWIGREKNWEVGKRKFVKVRKRQCVRRRVRVCKYRGGVKGRE